MTEIEAKYDADFPPGDPGDVHPISRRARSMVRWERKEFRLAAPREHLRTAEHVRNRARS